MKITALFATLALSVALHAQAPTVTSSKSSYRVGEDISIAFTNGPANAKDWIGIYPSSIQPGGATGSTIWFYVDGSKDGNTGVAEGVINFPKGLSTAGNWTAYLLENDGYNQLASFNFTTVAGPSVTTDQLIYATNQTIQATFANGPGNAADWVGIYREGQTPGGPESTIWQYVNGTHTATTGKASGTLVFTNGLASTGNWVVYFLANDGYTQLASNKFTVGSVPAVAPQHSSYYVGSPVIITFTNGPANLKDWIGIYPEGSAPGGPPATIWQYTDANGGKAGAANGNVTFNTGLTNAGAYVVYFLKDDGYSILASNKLSILELDAPLLWLDSSIYQTKQAITAYFTNAPGNPKDWVGIYKTGQTPGQINSTIWFYLDGTQAGVDSFTSGSVTFSNGLNAAGDWVAYLLENDGYNILAQEAFKVVAGVATKPTNNIILGTPIYFENFDSTPEGQVPAGWTLQSFTEVMDEELDLSNINSKSYANWVVVDANRFNSSLLSYNAKTPTDDYQRVLSTNVDNVVNGVVVTNLGTGRILFGDSGYRSGRSQVIYAFTPDYNLAGKSNVYVSFHSLYEQNQDSIGALEYSIDGGTNWLPIVYMLNRGDILTNASGVDAEATFTTEYTSGNEAVAYYTDPDTGEDKGGTYGTFIAAPISQALAPYVSARVDDDPIESKRVEYFRIAQADNQSRVRFRFAYAGTDSWYWGIDDFGIYGAGGSSQGQITLTVSQIGNNVAVSWTGGDGQLQKTTALGSGTWQPVQVTAGTKTFTEPIQGGAAFYRVLAQ
jgi:hypothetical protein